MRKQLVKNMEIRRLALQNELDNRKNASERNRMGQFATPTGLSLDIQRYAKSQMEKCEKVRFVDPAFGTGAFYSALLEIFPSSRIHAAVGYEVDQHYGKPTAKLWADSGLDIRIEDFTQSEVPCNVDKFNLLICNPPYVRHHHIPKLEKHRLRKQVINTCDIEINGLAGLYCYFLVLSHSWMADGGLAGWLIPSEFMDVNYGMTIKRYLLTKVTLLHIHRFDPNDVQFNDALVSSAVVWFRNLPPKAGHQVRFTFGGTLAMPKLKKLIPAEKLFGTTKWTRFPSVDKNDSGEGPILSDYFNIKRGIATGCNRYFILTDKEIQRRGLPIGAFKPILPSPRYVRGEEIKSDQSGNPILERRLFVLDPPWAEDDIRQRYPNLWLYLEEGRAVGIADRYICQHRNRWYCQERRSPAPIVCTYLGRMNTKSSRPFRFLLNNSNAMVTNVYLMLYPKEPIENVFRERPELLRQVCGLLNKICPQVILREGRVYGGGLHKLEPKELGNVSADSIASLLPKILPKNAHN